MTTNPVSICRAVSEIVASRARDKLGYEDTFFPSQLDSRFLTVEKAGGGVIIKPSLSSTIRELHIISHGGILIPHNLTWMLAETDPFCLSEIVFENNDCSVNAVATYLASTIEKPEFENRALAYFTVPRVIIDPNRVVLEQQFSEPYKGASILRELTQEQKRMVSMSLFKPWVDAIGKISGTGKLEAIFHHHTYDKVGTGAVAHEKVSGHVRPAGMFFHKYWRIDKKGMKIGEKAEFMSNALLADLIRIFKSHLSQLVPDARVTVDWPYESPIMLPSLIVDHYLTGGIEGNKPATIAYETRKDLLVGRSNLNVLLAAIEEMVTSARQFICNR